MLNKQELKKIVESIREAEGQTSVEIRVCMARRCKGDPCEAAGRKFVDLKMHETALRNSILIYVAPDDRKTAIVGDSGINAIAGDGFWDSVIHEMLFHFTRKEICAGICRGVAMAGDLVKSHYPVSGDNINELSDEVIIDEE